MDVHFLDCRIFESHIQRFADLELGLVDASIVSFAEELGCRTHPDVIVASADMRALLGLSLLVVQLARRTRGAPYYVSD